MAYVDQRLRDFLDLVGDRTPAPGGGAVAAVTVSLAGSLVAMCGDDELAAEMHDLRRRSDALADDDAAAYSAFIAARRAGGDTTEALTRATRVPLEVAGVAAAVAGGAARVLTHGRAAVRGDAATALLLADAAARSATYLVEVNVEAGGLERDLVTRARAFAAAARDAAQELDPSR